MPFQRVDLFALKAQRTDLKAVENMLLLQHKEMKAAECTLLLQLADTQTRLKQMDSQIARIVNSTTPLYSLPDEIIIAIIHIGRRTSRDFPMLVSHISHRMRELAIGSPTLWTQIAIRSCLDQVKTYLSRSRRCLLTISARGSRHSAEQLRQALLHIDRWRSLSVCPGFRNNEVLARFCTLSAPRLESLNLGPMDEHSEIPSQLFVSAPMLSKMCLSSSMGFSLDPIMFLPTTITSLDLVNGSFSNFDGFYRFVLTMPNLMNLKLLGLEVYSSSTSTHTTTSLPSLVTFAISGRVDYLRDVCELLAMPSLRHLEVFVPLNELHSFATWLSAVTRVCGSPYPAIRWLEFDFGDVYEYDGEIAVEVMKKLIHGFPNVTHVSIHFVNQCTVAPLMCLCDDTAWPHLDTLTIRDFSDTEEGLIHQQNSRKQIRLRQPEWGLPTIPADIWGYKIGYMLFPQGMVGSTW